MFSIPMNPEAPTPTFDAEVLEDEPVHDDDLAEDDVVADDPPTVDEEGEPVLDPDANDDRVDSARADRLAAGARDEDAF